MKMNKMSVLGLLSVMILMSITVNAEMYPFETEIEVKTFQEGNVSMVEIVTEEDTYEFDCTLSQEYQYDIDILREMSCSEIGLNNISGLIYAMSQDNHDIVDMLNKTTTNSINTMESCSKELAAKISEYTTCTDDLSESYTQKQYDTLFLNYTTMKEDFEEAENSKTMWGFGGLLLGGAFVYFMLMKKFPKNPDSSTLDSTWV